MVWACGLVVWFGPVSKAFGLEVGRCCLWPRVVKSSGVLWAIEVSALGNVEDKHGDADCQKLQANAPAHELLARIRTASPQNVPKSGQQNDENGESCGVSGNGQRLCHEAYGSLVVWNRDPLIVAVCTGNVDEENVAIRKRNGGISGKALPEKALGTARRRPGHRFKKP